jgi:hypothetical protein
MSFPLAPGEFLWHRGQRSLVSDAAEQVRRADFKPLEAVHHKKMNCNPATQVQQFCTVQGNALMLMPVSRRDIKAFSAFSVALLFLSITVGCADIAKELGYVPAPATELDSPKPVPAPKIAHHFEPIAKSEGSLAVDTATGQMCKTWDWVCTKSTWKNPWTGKSEESSRYGISCSALESMPTCEQLSNKD